MDVGVVKLREILVDSNLLESSDFDAAVESAKSHEVSLEQELVDKALIPGKYLGQLIAEAIGFPFVNMNNINIPDHVLRIVPERVAKKVGAVAFGKDEKGRIKLAMRDPGNLGFLRMIEKKMCVRVIPYYMTHAGLRLGLEFYSKDLNSAILRLLEEHAETKADDGESPGVVRILDLIMNYAYQSNASDIHVEPRENTVVVRYRIDGILHDVVSLPKTILSAFVTRVKILARLRTDEHFAAQDGKFREVIDGERLDVRVSVIPIVSGEKIVMRLLSERGRNFDLTDLGLGDRDVKRLRKLMKKSFGMLLATGPTGSGKTTTMYAVLKELNTRDVNIATIEDPIEYGIEGVNQIQVNPKTGLTFASGLRSIVRQDPDIIMVGEIRDEETAGIAVNAAMTGHLVLSTLHTNDSATTLPRFRDMKIEPFLTASTVNAIVAQRLIRRICSRCIMSFDVKVEDLRDELDAKHLAFVMKGKGKTKKTVKFYKGKGCDKCGHTGYSGRVGIYEVLEVTDRIKELIMTDVNASDIKKAAIEEGMTTMFEDGLRKAMTGVTTLEEVKRVTGEE